MYTPFLRISEIPVWLPDGHIRAQRYHLQRFQRWLLTAGASPRVGMVLATENEAMSAVFAELLLGGIEIQQCTSSPRRPLPEKLLRHQGDHFNRTLFVIDGLDSYGDDWSMLERYLHHFARTATWGLFRLRDLANFASFKKQLQISSGVLSDAYRFTRKVKSQSLKTLFVIPCLRSFSMGF